MALPNLNALYMFDAAARHENFRLASEELHLTQGAVAQQVRQIEARLGVKFFERKARGLALTEVGRSYHNAVRQALAIIAEATARLQPLASRVTISTTPSFASKWLIARLVRFTEAHPDIEIRTVASEGLSNFTSDDVDIAIRLGKPPFNGGLNAELLAPQRLIAVCSPEYAATMGTIEHLEELAAHHLIQDSHRHWDRLLAVPERKPQRRTMIFNQTALAMDAAVRSHGIAIAPELLVAEEVSLGRLVPVWREIREEETGFYVVYPKTQPPNAKARDQAVAWLLAEAVEAPGS
ncbi:LysR substrate-binding domain-containing protein [Limibacillus halophilus]|uniref:LysR family glycine cleavage system transcriptional activator n=1 Tax=Limibacillus halophilus TaxID=1579333 RepID=A0A839SVJ3_9PROT|nr:LysR substrate-binding domain-containing protein [Limibacillus halophilus]MBB3064995.1 LysR family glycine cleavage system transcriptional activator [Limibacillus halophilus]